MGNIRELLKINAEDFTTKYNCTAREAYIEGGQWMLENLWHNTTPTQFTHCLVKLKVIDKRGNTVIYPRLATYIPSFIKIKNEPWVIHYQPQDDFEEVEIMEWLDLDDIGLNI